MAFTLADRSQSIVRSPTVHADTLSSRRGFVPSSSVRLCPGRFRPLLMRAFLVVLIVVAIAAPRMAAQKVEVVD